MINFLRNKKNKHISLVEIIFLVSSSADLLQKPLTFEMDQLIHYKSQLHGKELNKRVVYEVSAQKVNFGGGQHNYNAISFKDISTREMLLIQNERT